jgi:hypothetical protein
MYVQQNGKVVFEPSDRVRFISNTNDAGTVIRKWKTTEKVRVLLSTGRVVDTTQRNLITTVS